MIAGQTLADWTRLCDALAHGWRAQTVTATTPAPGWITLTVRTRDHLATAIPLPAPAATDLEAVTIGVTEDGLPWVVQVAGRHLLVAGATGAGKGSVVWSILAGLAPAVHAGVVRLWVVDPKGGMEFGAATALFDRFVHTTGAPTLELPAPLPRSCRSVRTGIGRHPLPHCDDRGTAGCGRDRRARLVDRL
jgi:S-DNA-T family DNA segregation ATPase FtsK/SpoIIIE